MVNDVAVNVKLDLTRNRGQQVVYARQNDTKVFNLHIVLTNNGRVVDLSQAVACIMYIKKPNGTEYANSMTRNGNELSYTIRTQDVDETGEVKAQVYVGLNDGTKFTSPVFTIQVYSDILSADINNLNIDSVNQYNAITDILAEAQKTVLEAKAHADSALQDVTEVEEIYEQVVVIKTDIEETVEDAIETIEAAITSAEASATAAAASATSATASETNAAASVVSAQSYAQQAETHKTSAETAVSTASGYASAAADSATAAAASAENIDTYVTAAESWAIGGTESREGEDTNNAKYYAEKAETAAGSVEGALKPVGTITFAEIPADLSGKEGNMYNISDDFTSDARFKDGSGKSYAAGTNIYVTYDYMLDCLVGKTYTLPTASSATLGGIKVGENMDIDADGYLTALSSAVILYSEAEYNAIPEADKAKNDYLVLDDSFDNGMKLYIKGNHVVIPKEYVLPIASANTLGGIKIGENLTIDENGVVSAEAGGDSITVLDTQAEYDALSTEEKESGAYVVLEGTVPGESGGYTLPKASTTELGGVKVGIGLSIASDGTLSSNSANVYSTDETVIGTWIDGKPLYRKVYAGTYTERIAVDTWVELVDLTGLDYDYIRTHFDYHPYEDANNVSTSVHNGNTTAPYGVAQKVRGTKFMILVSPSPVAINKYYLTVEYTKTTD